LDTLVYWHKHGNGDIDESWWSAAVEILDAARVADAREARLAALGFEEPTEEQRRENLAQNLSPIVEKP
jgi:hypothetical protein